MKKTLSAKDIATHLGVSVQTVRRWAREGKLPAARPTQGKYFFRPEDVDKFFDIPNTSDPRR